MRTGVRLLGVLGVLALLVTGVGLALLKLGALDGARASVAARLLSAQLGAPVTVAGPVSIGLGRSVTVSLEGMRGAADPSGRPSTKLRLVLSSTDLLRGRFRPEALELSGLHLRLDAPAAAGDSNPIGPRIAGAVAGYLSSALAANLSLDDVQIVRDTDPDGWTFALTLTQLTSRATVDGRSIELGAEGTLNGVPFSVSGRAPRFGHDGADDAIALDLRVKGLDAALKGRLTEAPGGPAFDGQLTAVSTALGALLETLDLAPELEGSARADLSLAGPLSALSATTTTLSAATERGHELNVEGRLSDLWAGHGLDLHFDVLLARPATTLSDNGLAPRHISGQLSGDVAKLEIDELTVDTDLADLDLARIGPISVSRVARDAEGRVRLEGVRLLQGDPSDPMIDLSGNLEDLLGLSGITAEGEFALALAPLLGFPAPVDLGVLRGSVALSDATGALGVETLDAATGSGARAALALKRGAQAPETAVDLDIADLGALAKALGHEDRFGKGARFGFQGRIGVAAGAAGITGALQVGATAFDGQLSVSVEDDAPVATGTLHTRLLHPEDLTLARDAASMLAGGIRPETVRVDPQAASGALLTLDASAGAIAGSTAGASDVTAHLELSKTSLSIDPFDLHYFGGRIDGSLAVQLGQAAPPLGIEARIRAVDLAAVFAAFGQAASVAGPLDMDLAVRGAGRTPGAFLASLSGSVAASIYDGQLSKRVVNLAGQSIISWVFDRGPDGGAPLVCLVSAMKFQEGAGKVQELVAETDKVQFVGTGALNLSNRSIDLTLTPRPKRRGPGGTIGPVIVRGPLDAPKVSLTKGSVAGKVVGDTLGLPFRALGRIAGGGRPSGSDQRPCVVVLAPAQRSH